MLCWDVYGCRSVSLCTEDEFGDVCLCLCVCVVYSGISIYVFVGNGVSHEDKGRRYINASI